MAFNGFQDKADFLEYLIDTYQKLIFSICYKMTENYFEAEDLTQETFLSAYRNLDKFDGVNEKSWLCKIATNKALDYLRSAAHKQIPMEEEFFLVLAEENNEPEKQCLAELVKEQLLGACNSLGPPYDKVAIDYFCEEKSISEIAKKYRCKEKTIQTQVYRAKKKIRKKMERSELHE